MWLGSHSMATSELAVGVGKHFLPPTYPTTQRLFSTAIVSKSTSRFIFLRTQGRWDVPRHLMTRGTSFSHLSFSTHEFTPTVPPGVTVAPHH